MKIVPPPYACTTIEEDARHRRILRYATEAFLSNGYAGTSVENIAIDASVSKLTIYRTFTDKLGLATAVMLELSNSLERDCRTAIDMEASPEECLTSLALTYIRWMNRGVGRTHNFEFLRLLMEMCGSHPEVARAWIDSNRNVIAKPLTKYISKRIEAGDMWGEDPYLIAVQFMGSIYHPSQSIVAVNAFNDDIELTRRKVRLFLAGCAGDARKSPIKA